jgi:5-methylcytosine-specific restriction endonuclease McrA
VQKTCQKKGCRNTARNLGLCQKHYTQQRIKKYPKCKVQGCQKPSFVLKEELCSAHYQMNKKHGNPLAGAYRMPFKKAIDHKDGTRTCTKCQQRLPKKEFHKDKTASGGLRAKCKKCRTDHVKGWYADNRERQATRELVRRRSNPDKYAEKESQRYKRDKSKRLILATEHAHLRKARKKKTKTERGISKKSLMKKYGTKCHYCGKEMDFSNAEGRKFNRNMATIEHIIPLAKGGEHTFANTVLACRHCNLSKNAKTVEEFIQSLQ